MSKVKVLFFAADPFSATPDGRHPRLLLDENMRQIRQKVRAAEYRDELDINERWAVRTDDLIRALKETRPQVVHFSGHGGSKGLVLVGADGRTPLRVDAAALAQLFEIFHGDIRVVVLSACFFLPQAQAIAEAVGCAVGTRSEISDQAAITFDASFYRAIAFGHSVQAAYDQARVALTLEHYPERECPVLLRRGDVDPSRLMLIPAGGAGEWSIGTQPSDAGPQAVPYRASEKARVSQENHARETPARRGADIRIVSRQAPPQEDGVVYKVWFATNRKPRMREGGLAGYGARMDESVHQGSCEVFVPRSHMIGSLGSSWWKRLLSASDDRLRLRVVRPMADAEYWADLRSRIQELAPDERNAVVFIHGYNVSFDAAALRTAQLGFDLNVPGPIAFFSWPSRAGLLGYLMDGAMVEASEGAIAEFLTAFAQNTGAERVHVIAHSMGNRGLLRAAQRIVGRAEAASAVRFTHLILAAPDVTRKLFLELAANYHRLAARTTLYISDRDRALRMSRFLQGERVGYAPPITTYPGVDSIYVANVDRTFMGHSPFAESRPVLNDIHELISHDAPPGERMGLRLISAPGSEPYWEIMK